MPLLYPLYQKIVASASHSGDNAKQILLGKDVRKPRLRGKISNPYPTGGQINPDIRLKKVQNRKKFPSADVELVCSEGIVRELYQYILCTAKDRDVQSANFAILFSLTHKLKSPGRSKWLFSRYVEINRTFCHLGMEFLAPSLPALPPPTFPKKITNHTGF